MKDISSLFSMMEEQYGCFLGTVPGIVYALDNGGNFTYLSESIESILGYSNTELLGTHFSNLVHPDDLKEVSRTFVLPRFAGIPTGSDRAPKLFDERRACPRKTTDLKVRLRSKYKFSSENELVVSCKVNASGQYGSDNEKEQRFCGTVGIIFDVVPEDGTKILGSRKRYNTTDLLSQALAHAFSNVFTGIYGNLQLIEMQLEDDHQFTGNIEAIKNSVEKAVTLIKQLSSAIADAGKDNRSLPILLDEVASDVLAESSLTYKCKFDPDLWEIESDPDYIRHILRSLFFFLRYNTSMNGVLPIRVSNVAEKLGKLPRMDCHYLKVTIILPAEYFRDCSGHKMEGCNEVLEKITTMALSYSLLKKIGAAMEVFGVSESASVTLYLPAGAEKQF